MRYETIRCWTIKFGPLIATNLKRKRLAPSPRGQLDEVVCAIGAGALTSGGSSTTNDVWAKATAVE